MQRWVGVAISSIGIAVLSGATPAWARGSDGHSPAWCGFKDTPETGIQGDVPLADQQSGRAEQGYNCGLAVVGYNDLGGDGFGLRTMAWADHCAYVRHSEGIKVIDVSDPTDPTVVDTLPIQVTSENLHAVTTRDRSLLVAAGAGQPVPAYVWDVSTCTEPNLLGIAEFPGLSPENPNVVNQIHNIELTPDATKIYGSLPLQVADITDLSDPSTWAVQQFQCELAAQATPGFAGFLIPQIAFALDHPECGNQLAHEFEFNKAGTRMYIGGQLPDVLGDSRDPLGRDWDTEHELRVVGITVWPPQLISEVPGTGHGVRRATIGRKPFLLHSNENVNPDVSTANGCSPDSLTPIAGAAQAFLTGIRDETAPITVSELELAINDEANCAAQLESRVKSTIHYHELDDPDDTTFAMLAMGNAGLRVFDVRNPKKPREVAYFNPGAFRLSDDSTTLDGSAAHIHYDARQVRCREFGFGHKGRKCDTGYIWLTTRVGGFWVLELEPQVRWLLGLPLSVGAAEYPFGRPARPSDL